MVCAEDYTSPQFTTGGRVFGASGKSSDFPGVVGNPLLLVRFRQTDRFWAPLSETGPAPPAP